MKNFILTVLFLSISATIWCQNINNNLVEISKSIIEQLTDQNKKTIAIIDFSSPNGEVSELGRSLSNKLRINIAKNTREIKIVNRSILQNALKEEQLLKDGIIDPESAKKIKFIGVEVIILGEISDYGNDYSIEIQLIDTEQSDIIGGEILEVPKTESLRELNEKILTKKIRKTVVGSVDSEVIEIETSDYYPIERELGDIKVKIESVRFNSNRIRVSFKVYNKMNDPMEIGIYSGNKGRRQSKINHEGEIYFSSSARIANETCSRPTSCKVKEIISGKTWVKGMVEFDRNIPNIKMANILQINFYYTNKGKKYHDLVLRDIPLEN